MKPEIASTDQVFSPEPAPAIAGDIRAAGKAFSIRFSPGLIERLSQDVRTTDRSDGEQLAGILLGSLLPSEQCVVVEDYQTITRRLHPDRPDDWTGDQAGLQRALAIWRSDPEGRIRAIGLFRTDDVPIPKEADLAMLGRYLHDQGNMFLVLGIGREGSGDAVACFASSGACASVQFVWGQAEVAAPEHVVHQPTKRPRRLRVGIGVLLAASAGMAITGAGITGYWIVQSHEPARSTKAADAVARALDPVQTQIPGSAGAVPVTQQEGHAAVAPRAPDLKPAAEPPAQSTIAAPQREASTAVIERKILRPKTGVSAAKPGEAPGAAQVSVARRDKNAVASRSIRQLDDAKPRVSMYAPVLIWSSAPVYPQAALEARISGTVKVAARVLQDGQLWGVHAISGPLALQEAAVEAVQGWRYKPALTDGRPVAADVVIELPFQPDE